MIKPVHIRSSSEVRPEPVAVGKAARTAATSSVEANAEDVVELPNGRQPLDRRRAFETLLRPEQAIAIASQPGSEPLVEEGIAALLDLEKTQALIDARDNRRLSWDALEDLEGDPFEETAAFSYSAPFQRWYEKLGALVAQVRATPVPTDEAAELKRLELLAVLRRVHHVHLQEPAAHMLALLSSELMGGPVDDRYRRSLERGQLHLAWALFEDTSSGKSQSTQEHLIWGGSLRMAGLLTAGNLDLAIRTLGTVWETAELPGTLEALLDDPGIHPDRPSETLGTLLEKVRKAASPLLEPVEQVLRILEAQQARSPALPSTANELIELGRELLGPERLRVLAELRAIEAPYRVRAVEAFQKAPAWVDAAPTMEEQLTSAIFGERTPRPGEEQLQEARDTYWALAEAKAALQCMGPVRAGLQQTCALSRGEARYVAARTRVREDWASHTLPVETTLAALEELHLLTASFVLGAEISLRDSDELGMAHRRARVNMRTGAMGLPNPHNALRRKKEIFHEGAHLFHLALPPELQHALNDLFEQHRKSTEPRLLNEIMGGEFRADEKAYVTDLSDPYGGKVCDPKGKKLRTPNELITTLMDRLVTDESIVQFGVDDEDLLAFTLALRELMERVAHSRWGAAR